MGQLWMPLLVAFGLTPGCSPRSEAPPPSLATPTLEISEPYPEPPTLVPTAFTLSDERIPVTVSGWVVGGGDTSPEGLLDAPRVYLYQVEQQDGSIVNVSYRALPPGPGNLVPEIRLAFHAGTILIGDYLVARGVFDPASLTLQVTEKGDYIETSPEKP